MKKRLAMLMIVVFAVPVFADWEPNGPYKMHWPQLPDAKGWDVIGTNPIILADDWTCTETGPVSQVHLWGSWRSDDIGRITNIHLSIHENIPADDVIRYSRPGPLLWEEDFNPNQFTVRNYGTGLQGWYVPGPDDPVWNPDEHQQFHQINIMNIQDPFRQIEKTVYWLDVSVKVESPDTTFWGWKSCLFEDRHLDDAVWAQIIAGAAPEWRPLTYPDGQSMDLAFVIVPEPATLSLLALGGLLLLRKRK